MSNVISGEMKKKLRKAQSVEETAGILKDCGWEASEEEIAQIFFEIQNNCGSREVSPEEMEAASGGKDRDWVRDGCAATVEYGSWCLSNDKCELFDVTYDNMISKRICPKCGGKTYIHTTTGSGARKQWYYKCLNCGAIHNNFNQIVPDPLENSYF